MNEVWKDIPGFEGYQISNDGRVRSCRYGSRGGLKIHPHKYREITLSMNGCKTHYVIDLVNPQFERLAYSIHRLLYAVFIGPIPDGMLIDHIDRNGLNNVLSNLRLATRSQNVMNQKIRTGRKYKAVRQTKSGRFECRTTFQGKAVGLGRFNTALEAAKKYNEWAVKTYGEYAVLNPIEEIQ